MADLVSQVIMWPIDAFGVLSAEGIGVNSLAPVAVGIALAWAVKGNPVSVVEKADLMEIGMTYLLVGAGYAAGNYFMNSGMVSKKK